MSLIPLNSHFIKTIQNKLNDECRDNKTSSMKKEILSFSVSKSLKSWICTCKTSVSNDSKNLLESGKFDKLKNDCIVKIMILLPSRYHSNTVTIFRVIFTHGENPTIILILQSCTI